MLPSVDGHATRTRSEQRQRNGEKGEVIEEHGRQKPRQEHLLCKDAGRQQPYAEENGRGRTSRCPRATNGHVAPHFASFGRSRAVRTDTLFGVDRRITWDSAGAPSEKVQVGGPSAVDLQWRCPLPDVVRLQVGMAHPSHTSQMLAPPVPANACEADRPVPPGQ